MAKVTDDLFDKAVNETSFAIPTTRSKSESKEGPAKPPVVSGDYLGHIVQVNSKVVDVKGGEFKARVYDYFVEVAPENKENKYTYKRYSDDETVDVDGSSYSGYKFKGSIFKYLEPGDKDTFKSRSELNKYYLWFCESCGVECPIITTKIDGQEIEVKSLPVIKMDELVGTPVQAVVGKGNTWTDSDGNERTPWVVKFVRDWKDGKKREIDDNDIPF